MYSCKLQINVLFSDLSDPQIRRDFYLKWLDIKQQNISDAHIYLEVSTGKTENDNLYLTRAGRDSPHLLTLGSCVCTSLALGCCGRGMRTIQEITLQQHRDRHRGQFKLGFHKTQFWHRYTIFADGAFALLKVLTSCLCLLSMNQEKGEGPSRYLPKYCVVITVSI